MRVENYSDKYFQDVIRLIQAFHDEALSEYEKEVSQEAFVETIKMADKKNAFLLIIDGVCRGILYGMRVRSQVNGKMIFQEVMWYVDEKYRRYGIKLLNEVQKILKSEGIGIMIMAVLENSKTEKLKKFYSKIGYRAMETHYVKEL